MRKEAFLHPGPNALLGSAFSAGECLGIFTCPHFHTVSHPKDLQPPYDLIKAAFPSCLRFTENVLLPIWVKEPPFESQISKRVVKEALPSKLRDFILI